MYLSVQPAGDFETLGAAALGRVLDDEQLAVARAAFEDVLEMGVEGPYARIVHDPWRKSAALAGLAPHLGQLTGAALGIPELVLLHDHLLFKPSGGVDMDWHQNFSFLPLDRPDGLTLWVALDDITPENGCLYYLFGSHLLGERRANWGMTGEDDPRYGLASGLFVPAAGPSGRVDAVGGTGRYYAGKRVPVLFVRQPSDGRAAGKLGDDGRGRSAGEFAGDGCRTGRAWSGGGGARGVRDCASCEPVAPVAGEPERPAAAELGVVVCVAGCALVTGAYAASAERGGAAD